MSGAVDLAPIGSGEWDVSGRLGSIFGLAGLRETGITAIPKATGEAHIRDNCESLTVELDDDGVARIDATEMTNRVVHPGFVPAAWD